MVHIVPAVLEATTTEVAQKLLRAKEFTSDVQVDVVDGSFVGPATWPYTEGLMQSGGVIATLPHSEALTIELDLMVDDPERTLSTWMNIGARRIVFHLESTLHMKDILETLSSEYGYEKGFMSDSLAVGIALNQDTHLALLEPYLDSIDFVQFMGIAHIGKQAQPFAPEVLTKIKIFRQKHPNISVQVDGGVSLETAPTLLELGVSRLIVGSRIWNTEKPERSYGQFIALREQHGLYASD